MHIIINVTVYLILNLSLNDMVVIISISFKKNCTKYHSDNDKNDAMIK